MDTHLLINGKFAAGTEAAEKILNPRTGEPILELPEASAEQIDAAARGAREAFETWSRTTPSERSAALLRIAERIEAEDFGRLEAPRRISRRPPDRGRQVPPRRLPAR